MEIICFFLDFLSTTHTHVEILELITLCKDSSQVRRREGRDDDTPLPLFFLFVVKTKRDELRRCAPRGADDDLRKRGKRGAGDDVQPGKL